MTSTVSGSPFEHQRAFLQRGALAECPQMRVVTVSGPDRLTWLHSLITQDVLSLSPGQTTESLILDPQGRIEHAFFLVDDGQTSWLLTDAARGEALASWLTTMKFRMDVALDAHDGKVVAAAAESSLPGGAPVTWSDPWPRIEPGSVGYSPEPHPGEGWSLAYGLYGPASELPGEHQWVDASVLDALQVAAGRPTLADIDQTSLPHEYDWLRTAVHLNKGCYRGQETVAKVHNLGHPPRRFTLLHLDGSGSILPKPGASVLLGDSVVGEVTRAAWHAELGPIALARLKRSADPAAELVVEATDGPIAASQHILVAPDAGQARPRPKLQRL